MIGITILSGDRMNDGLSREVMSRTKFVYLF